MRSSIISLAISVTFLSIIFVSPLFASGGQENFFYYLIPPSSTIQINDKDVTNEDQKVGKMFFKKQGDENIVIDSETRGVSIISKNYEVDVKNDGRLKLSNTLTLEAGSIHVTTFQQSTEENTLYIGDLELRFQSADFLAFASGNNADKVIKVIEGELHIENPSADQKTVLQSQQVTSTDKEGKLLVPLAFQIEPKLIWWDSNSFEFDYHSLPIAHAGEDQRVLGNISVILNGSQSEFETGDIFEWTLVKGPKDNTGKTITQVAFDSTNIVKPLFTPIFDGEYHFSLQITDEEGSKSNLDQAIVYVGSRYLQPIAIFPDVPSDHPNNLAITYLYKKNVMKGSEDPATGKILFRPDDRINRVEILKTVFENKGQKIPSEEELRSLDEEIFLDVKADHWFAPYVYLAKKMGIVKGNDGLYRPADDVILVEAMKIIAEAYQISLDTYQLPGKNPYPDTEVDAWYNPYLFFVKKYNLIDVDPTGNIYPGKPVTRAQFAEIIYRMESINLIEKRGFISGILKDSSTGEGVSGAEIFIYTAEEDSGGGGTDNGFYVKGSLIYKSDILDDGTFHISLPIQSKYYVEAISGDNISTNRIIPSLEEDQSINIELEISIGEDL